MSTEFMLQLHKRLTEKTYGDPPRTLSSTTADAYLKTLFNLNDKKPFKNLSFLKKTDGIMAKLADYAETTKKTLLSSITSVLSLEKDNAGYKKAYKFYYDKMMEKTAEAQQKDTTVKTETQKENWLTWEEVKDKQQELFMKMMEDANQKAPLSPTQFNTLLSYIVLSLYIDVAPRRNQDYLNMYVYKALKKEKVIDLPKDKNYLIVSNNLPTQFIFNVYKTSKTYGQQIVNIPDNLQICLKYYLTRVGNKAKEYKFLPIDKVNAITRLLNKIFGKNVGSSMLRHIYLSDKYNITDMKEDAKNMGHSLAEQKAYMKITPMLEG